MRVGVATVYTPGIHGGAEFLARGLEDALARAGHCLHQIRMPFNFEPASAVRQVMEQAQALDFTRYGGGQIDALIALKFPATAIAHPNKALWLLHQHRPAYDLFGTPHGWQRGVAETDALADEIKALDDATLGGARAVFTIAKRVSERLMEFNGIGSTTIYHPPANAESFHRAEPLGYIFAPSRLEALKRQDLLLRGLAASGAPVPVMLAGSGGQEAALKRLAEDLGIADRVRFLGAVSRAEMITLYAHASAVFFGPLDEDYGYVTLEAMLSGKPVVTCSDSGGPLEFVVDGETGIVCQPTPEAVGAAIARIAACPQRASEMGHAGLARYRAMDIGWDAVIETLLGVATGRARTGLAA